MSGFTTNKWPSTTDVSGSSDFPGWFNIITEIVTIIQSTNCLIVKFVTAEQREGFSNTSKLKMPLGTERQKNALQMTVDVKNHYASSTVSIVIVLVFSVNSIDFSTPKLLHSSKIK